MLLNRTCTTIGVLALALSPAASAAVVGISSATYQPPQDGTITDPVTLTSVTDSDGVTYTGLEAASSVAFVGTSSFGLTFGTVGNVPSTDAAGAEAALTNLDPTDGVANIGDAVNFFFANGVTDQTIVVTEFGGADNFTIRAIDIGGNVIGGPLEVPASTFSQFGFMTFATSGGASSNTPLRGIVLNLGDIDAGLSGAAGIQLSTANGDPAVVALAIPEPASLALLAIGASVMASRRRR